VGVGFLTVLLAGCPGEPKFGGTIVLGDEENYTYEAHIDLSHVEVAAGQDCDVDWSALDTDLQGHPIDPAADVDEVYLTKFSPGLTETDLEGKIAEGKLLQEDIFGAPLLYENASAGTAMRLADFEFLGGLAFVPGTDFVDDGAVWALSLATEGQPSFRMSSFVAPIDGSPGDRIDVGDQSGHLDFAADLTSPRPISIPASHVRDIEWAGLTRNGLGDPIDFDRVEELLLGRYEDLTPEDLQGRVLDLELLAAEKYSMTVRGRMSADPSLAVDASGAAFPGFGSGELWLLVLRCSGPTCTNPAPTFLGVIEVE
jgi:hypothetical protein